MANPTPSNSTQQPNSISELEERIETIEENLKGFNDGVKLIHFYDKHFDSHAYREALKAEVIDKATEPIDKKYKTWIGVITTILALGGFTVINYVVQDKVETRIEEKMPELAAAGKKNQSDYLMALLELRELNQQSGQEAGWIDNQLDSREDFSSLLKDFIVKPDNNILEQRKYAITYAGDTQNLDLLEPLFAILNNDIDKGFSASSEDKYLALQAILKYPNQGRNINRVLEELEKIDRDSSQNIDLIKVFSLADISSSDTDTISRLGMFITDVFNSQKTLRSEAGNKTNLYNPVSLFFLRHPDLEQWEDIRSQIEKKDQNSSVIIKIDDLSQLIKMKASSDEMSVSEENEILEPKDQRELDEKIFNDLNTPLSEDFTLSNEIIREIYKEVSLILLEFGNSKSFYALPDYYSYSDWCNRVIPLFPDFNNAVSCEARSNAFKEPSNEDDLKKSQDQLWNEKITYDWSDEEKAYISVNDFSALEKLKDGSSLTDYTEYMSISYYDERIWEEEILPLFPDALKPESGAFTSAEESANYSLSNPPPGDDVSQDDLWYWVVDHQENLEWNSIDNKWELNNPSNQDE